MAEEGVPHKGPFSLADAPAQVLELAAGYGIGIAAGTLIAPVAMAISKELWTQVATMPLDAQTAALLARLGHEDYDRLQAEARNTGFDEEEFLRLYQASFVVPGAGQLLELLNRQELDEAETRKALIRGGTDERYVDKVLALARTHLSPAEAALARQQGYLSPEEQHAIAALWGIRGEDAEKQWQIVGLPPGPQEGLEMLRRGIIDEHVFRQMIAEGHTKTKYADAYLETLKPRLTPSEAVNAAVRQWVSLPQMKELLAEWGYDATQAQLLYDQHGRPPGPGQLQTAYNRGIIDENRFRKGIAESDVRVEWADVELALRRRYPSTFVLRQLVSSKAMEPARAIEILGYEGWEPGDAVKAVAAWKGTGAQKGKDLAKGEIVTLYEGREINRAKAVELLIRYGFDTAEAEMELELADARRIRRVKEAFIGRVNTSYVNHKIDRTQASSDLDVLGLPASARNELLALWDVERELNKMVLTPSEIVQLARRGVVSVQVAQQMLVQRGADENTAWLKLASHLGRIPNSPVANTITSLPG